MVYRLRTFLGRELVATPEHLLLTEDGWRPLGSLQFDDHVATAEAEASCVGWDCVMSVEPAGTSPSYDVLGEGAEKLRADHLIGHHSPARGLPQARYSRA